MQLWVYTLFPWIFFSKPWYTMGSNLPRTNVTFNLSINVKVTAGFICAPLKSVKVHPMAKTAIPIPMAFPIFSVPSSGYPSCSIHWAATKKYVARNSAKTSLQKAPFRSSCPALGPHSSHRISRYFWDIQKGKMWSCGVQLLKEEWNNKVYFRWGCESQGVI